MPTKRVPETSIGSPRKIADFNASAATEEFRKRQNS